MVRSRRRSRTVVINRRRCHKNRSRCRNRCRSNNDGSRCHNRRSRCSQTKNIPHKVDDISGKADTVAVMMMPAVMGTCHCGECTQSNCACDQKHLESFHFSNSFFCFFKHSGNSIRSCSDHITQRIFILLYLIIKISLFFHIRNIFKPQKKGKRALIKLLPPVFFYSFYQESLFLHCPPFPKAVSQRRQYTSTVQAAGQSSCYRHQLRKSP